MGFPKTKPVPKLELLVLENINPQIFQFRKAPQPNLLVSEILHSAI